MKPRLLDLYCKAGGAGWGYHLAGFDVTGVDIRPQPRYPLAFMRGDALEYLAAHGHEYDAIHASPPCQAFSNAQRIMGRQHPDLVGPTRELLLQLGKPWVIENVEGAPLHGPVTLCGAMFGLRTYRHRLFEASFPLTAPEHRAHTAPLRKMGRPVRDGEFIHIVGNFSGAALAREVMGMPWATRDELREAIPTAYTQHVGKWLMAWLTDGNADSDVVPQPTLLDLIPGLAPAGRPT